MRGIILSVELVAGYVHEKFAVFKTAAGYLPIESRNLDKRIKSLKERLDAGESLSDDDLRLPAALAFSAKGNPKLVFTKEAPSLLRLSILKKDEGSGEVLTRRRQWCLFAEVVA